VLRIKDLRGRGVGERVTVWDGETLRGLGAGSFACWKVCRLGKEQRNGAGFGWEPVGHGWDSVYTGEDSMGVTTG
jgi:hypothetical protein